MKDQDDILYWCFKYLDYAQCQLRYLNLLKEEKELLINKVNEILEEIKNIDVI